MSDKIQPSFSPGRRWKIGLDVVVRTTLVLAVVVMANFLGAQFSGRFHVSLRAQQLSPRTLSVVRSITNKVAVTVYYDKSDDWYPMIMSLLNEYRSANPNISIKAVDYTIDAGDAEKTKEKYKLSSVKDKNLVIFECDGRWQKIYGGDLSQTQLVPDGSEDGKPAYRRKPVAFNGEMLFTAKLLAVETPKSFKAYFLQGDGEPALDDSGDRGYLQFGAVLGENFVETGLLDLRGQNAVPDDCDLLIIAGPREAFSEAELQKIDQYLAQGGRLFLLLNYFSIKQPTGLAPILARWGVNTLADVVQEHDPNNTHSGDDIIIYNFSTHPVVNELKGLPLQLVLPRPVGVVDSQNQAADAPDVQALVFSSPQSTLVDDPAAPPRAYPLMVAVEQKAVPGVASTRGNTRMVVVGDSFFLDNQMIAAAANRDFAGYAVNWLLDRTTLLKGIVPRPVTEYRLLMTQAQQINVRWLLLGALPGAVLLFGGIVWFARRK